MTATQVLTAVLETVLVTYAIVESKLFVQLRLVVATAAIRANAWLFDGFIHCPFCVGFWVAIVMGLRNGAGVDELVLTPACFILLLTWKRDLIRPSEKELEIAATIARSSVPRDHEPS